MISRSTGTATWRRPVCTCTCKSCCKISQRSGSYELGSRRGIWKSRDKNNSKNEQQQNGRKRERHDAVNLPETRIVLCGARLQVCATALDVECCCAVPDSAEQDVARTSISAQIDLTLGETPRQPTDNRERLLHPRHQRELTTGLWQ